MPQTPLKTTMLQTTGDVQRYARSLRAERFSRARESVLRYVREHYPQADKQRFSRTRAVVLRYLKANYPLYYARQLSLFDQPSAVPDADHPRAPKGGTDIGSKHYPGGEWVPKEKVEEVAEETGKSTAEVADEIREGEDPTDAPVIPGDKPQLTFDLFREQYKSLFKQAGKYQPNEIGFETFTQRMADLADEHPEWAERVENEEAPAGSAAEQLTPAEQAKYDAYAADMRKHHIAPRTSAEWVENYRKAQARKKPAERVTVTDPEHAGVWDRYESSFEPKETGWTQRGNPMHPRSLTDAEMASLRQTGKVHDGEHQDLVAEAQAAKQEADRQQLQAIVDKANRRSDEKMEEKRRAYDEYAAAMDELTSLDSSYDKLDPITWANAIFWQDKHQEVLADIQKRTQARQGFLAAEQERQAKRAAETDYILVSGVHGWNGLYKRGKKDDGGLWDSAVGGMPMPRKTLEMWLKEGKAKFVDTTGAKSWVDEQLAVVRQKAAEQNVNLEKRAKEQQETIDRKFAEREAERKEREAAQAELQGKADSLDKPAWEMTASEFAEKMGVAGADLSSLYHKAIFRAIRDGKDVPQHVLDQEPNFKVAKENASWRQSLSGEQRRILETPVPNLLEHEYLEKKRLDRINQLHGNLRYYRAELDKLGPRAGKKRADFEMWIRLGEKELARYEDLEHGTSEDNINADSWRKEYKDLMKKGISKGQVSDPRVIAQYPEFKTARTARERYEKGRHTSFANRSIAINESMQAKRGYKAKRQDGTDLTPRHLKEIETAVDEVEKAVGGSLKDVFAGTDITLAHTNGKHPFLMQAGGCYSPQEKTVSAGQVLLGIFPAKAWAHELGHWLDFEAGKAAGYSGRASRYSTGSSGRGRTVETTALADRDHSGGGNTLIDRARRTINDETTVRRRLKLKLDSLSTDDEKAELSAFKERLGPYWTSPVEVWARLFEQYVADELGHDPQSAAVRHDLRETAGWWTAEEFAHLKPLVKQEIERRLALVRSTKTGKED